MNATLTATVEKVVELAPRLKRKLVTELTAYQGLKSQLDAIKLAMDGHKAAIEKLRVETGETSLEIDGFKITLVQPAGRQSLDRKKLLEAGVLMSQLEQGTITKAVKSYTKVTTPGETERSYE
jgi:myo-inositol catabolism protein IolC